MSTLWWMFRKDTSSGNGIDNSSEIPKWIGVRKKPDERMIRDGEREEEDIST